MAQSHSEEPTIPPISHHPVSFRKDSPQRLIDRQLGPGTVFRGWALENNWTMKTLSSSVN